MGDYKVGDRVRGSTPGRYSKPFIGTVVEISGGWIVVDRGNGDKPIRVRPGALSAA